MNNKDIWKDKLATGEVIKKEFSIGTGYAKRGSLMTIIVGILLLPLFGIGLIFILAGAIGWFGFQYKYKYAFTNKRVLLLSRWGNEKLTSMNLELITDVHIRQSFIENLLFQTGTLALETAGNGSGIVLKHIEAPYKLAAQLQELRDEVK